MIYLSKYNILFVKTKKVGGTSFEIALSKFASNTDIITPISPQDEVLRKNLGFQGPVNFITQDRDSGLTDLGIKGDFFNHMKSIDIKNNLGSDVFNKCFKITIHRNPYDFLISKYFFDTRNKNWLNRPSFKKWLAENLETVNENYQIAPKTGNAAVDFSLCYECLQDDLLKIPFLPDTFLDTFNSITAKAHIRPQKSKDWKKFFNDEGCNSFIEKIKLTASTFA